MWKERNTAWYVKHGGVISWHGHVWLQADKASCCSVIIWLLTEAVRWTLRCIRLYSLLTFCQKLIGRLSKCRQKMTMNITAKVTWDFTTVKKWSSLIHNPREHALQAERPTINSWPQWKSGTASLGRKLRDLWCSRTADFRSYWKLWLYLQLCSFSKYVCIPENWGTLLKMTVTPKW